jgi:enamine deaminase RidA (YjgF/YER057c/UK114 family)
MGRAEPAPYQEVMMSASNRRTFLKKAPAVAMAAAVAAPTTALAQGATDKPVKKIIRNGPPPTTAPMFNGTVVFGNLVFVAGIGAHDGPFEIKRHTQIVLDQMKKQLEAAGSSMEKVLKVNVYLKDGKDFEGMNEIFRGKFGLEPGVRTTIAAAWVPGDSLVEIDCIAYI